MGVLDSYYSSELPARNKPISRDSFGGSVAALLRIGSTDIFQ